MQQISTTATQTTTDAARPPPPHSWATIDMDICEQDQCKYLLVVDYYSRFPVFITLPNTSATTVCEQFTQVLTKYGLSTTLMSDCCSQYMSERFKREFHNSNIMLKTSLPYHHQTNGVVERTIGTLKALLKKAQQKKKCPYTALWMYRTTLKKKMICRHHMNYCLAENPEQYCLQQGGGYNLATLEWRHLQKNEQNQAKQK